MPPHNFSLTVTPTFRDLSGRFTKATAAAAKQMRDDLKDEGARLRDLAREEAPSRTGAFAKKIGYRTVVGAGANLIKLDLTMPMPLGKFIVGGTKAHIIRPKRAQALFWEGLPHPVMWAQHPGTKPNPFVSRAYRTWMPGARSVLNSIGSEWSATIRRT